MSVYIDLDRKMQAIERRAAQLTKDTPVAHFTLRQLIILQRLYSHDSQKAKDLALSVNITPTSFTPVLDSLEIHSLIVRVPSTTDRRAVNIALTRTAKNLPFKNAVLETLEILEHEFKGWL